MKVEINVDETQFRDVLEKELQDLPKFHGQEQFLDYNNKGYIPDACKFCSNHPSNGGSGICNCTLGSPVIY